LRCEEIGDPCKGALAQVQLNLTSHLSIATATALTSSLHSTLAKHCSSLLADSSVVLGILRFGGSASFGLRRACGSKDTRGPAPVSCKFERMRSIQLLFSNTELRWDTFRFHFVNNPGGVISRTCFPDFGLAPDSCGEKERGRRSPCHPSSSHFIHLHPLFIPNQYWRFSIPDSSAFTADVPIRDQGLIRNHGAS